jgi:hypothetical protein
MDHALRRAGLRLPDLLFATMIPAGRQSSCPALFAPGGQPDPHYPSTGAGDEPPRWAHRPDKRRPHLLPPTQIPLP